MTAPRLDTRKQRKPGKPITITPTDRTHINPYAEGPAQPLILKPESKLAQKLRELREQERKARESA